MEFYRQPRNPVGNFAGLAAVLGLHVVIGMALLYGLARSNIKIFIPPEMTWIPTEIVKPSEPQARPPKALNKTPAPVLVPLPDISVDTPIIPPAGITSNHDATPAPADSGSAITEWAGPASNILGIACPNAQSIRSAVNYPAQARHEGLQGDVLARFIVGAAGDIRNVQIIRSTNRVFNAPVVAAVKQLGCVAQGQEVAVEMPFWFRLE